MFNDSFLAMFPGFAMDVLAKATLLLIAVSLLDLAMVRCAAAMRHRLWVTAFLGLLLLPLLSCVVPEYRLAVLPAHWIAGTPTSPKKDNQFDKISQEASLKSSTNSPLEAMQLTSQGSVADVRQSSSPSASLPFAQAESEARVDTSWSLASSEFATAQPTSASVWFQSVRLIAFVWCVGILVAIVPLLFGMFRIKLLERCSPSISDQEPWSTLDELCQKLCIRRRVALLETNRAIVPMTWGLRRPVVLLPAAWRDWEPERCRLVLLHELAHVKRLDVVYQSMARVACSILWFHPLVWYALSRLRVERELACDDCVLMAGERPSQYAQQLLSIALEYQSLALPTAVAIVQRSGLEKRVRAMLDQARSHLPLGPKVAVGMLLFSVAFLVLLAPIRLGISQPPDPRDVSAINLPKALLQLEIESEPDELLQPENTIANTTAKSEAAKTSDEYVFQGKVVHPDGSPAAGAALHWVDFEPDRLPDNSTAAVAKTDAMGAFKIRGAPDGSGEFMQLVATKVGFGIAATDAWPLETTGKLRTKIPGETIRAFLPSLGDDKTMRLVSDERPLTGRILTVEGLPLADARIRVSDISMSITGNLDRWEKATADSRADYYSLRKETSFCVNGFQLPSIVSDVMTDMSGKFKLPGIGKERVVQLTISGPGIETAIVFARTRDGKTIRVSNAYEHSQSRVDSYYANGFDYVAAPSVSVEGRIIDESTRGPLSGFLISSERRVRNSGSGNAFISTTTDKEGRFRINGLAQSDEATLFVIPPRGSRYLPQGVHPMTKNASGTVKVDLKLRPAALLRGRVMDISTGAPVAGAVQYSAMLNNPNLADHSAFVLSDFHECRADKEGRYEIAVLPGEGVVTFRADDSIDYRRVASKKTKIGDAFTALSERGMYETVPSYVDPRDYHFAKQIQIDSDAKETDLPIELSQGKTLRMNVVNSAGATISDAVVGGQAEIGGWYSISNGSAGIQGYYADQGREIFAYDPETHQAAHMRLDGPQPNEITISLRPVGTVRGRLMDKQGVAIESARLLCESIPGNSGGITSLRHTTDKEGRFELRGVIADYKHTVWAMIEGQGMMAIARDAEVNPITGLDLGDIVYVVK